MPRKIRTTRCRCPSNCLRNRVPTIDSGMTPDYDRYSGGNLRLLTRLLTQVERVLGVNDTQVISVEIVEAARDSLVIGQA
jgi:hypothetical protein